MNLLEFLTSVKSLVISEFSWTLASEFRLFPRNFQRISDFCLEFFRFCHFCSFLLNFTDFCHFSLMRAHSVHRKRHFYWERFKIAKIDPFLNIPAKTVPSPVKKRIFLSMFWSGSVKTSSGPWKIVISELPTPLSWLNSKSLSMPYILEIS